MSKKRQYNYVELWKREAIIECALTKSKSIKKRAQELGIKYITAKHIVKLYREQGRVVTKACRKEKSKFTPTNDSQMTPMIPQQPNGGQIGFYPALNPGCMFEEECNFGQNMLATQTPIQTCPDMQQYLYNWGVSDHTAVETPWSRVQTEFCDPTQKFMIQASTQDSMDSQIFCARMKEYLGDLVMLKESQ